MKKALTFALSTAIVFLITGCKDQSPQLVNPTPDIIPSLSSSTLEFEPGKIYSIDRLGVRREVTPVPWDGISELESGVVYYIKGIEQARKAADDDAEVLAWIDAYEAFIADPSKVPTKAKTKSTAKLSTDTWFAESNVCPKDPFFAESRAYSSLGITGTRHSRCWVAWYNGSGFLAYEKTMRILEQIGH